MRQVLLLLVMVPIFVLSSCSKDEENTNIVNSVWQMTDSGTSITLTFNAYTAEFIKEGFYDRITLYKYKNEYPKITFLPTEDSSVQLNGVINNDIMTIKNPTITSGSTVIYTLYRIK